MARIDRKLWEEVSASDVSRKGRKFVLASFPIRLFVDFELEL